MNHPERVILIALMAGIVSAGFTWFGWELFQNILAVLRRRALHKTQAAAQQKPEREAREKPAQKPAPPRKVNQKVG